MTSTKTKAGLLLSFITAIAAVAATEAPPAYAENCNPRTGICVGGPTGPLPPPCGEDGVKCCNNGEYSANSGCADSLICSNNTCRDYNAFSSTCTGIAVSMWANGGENPLTCFGNVVTCPALYATYRTYDCDSHCWHNEEAFGPLVDWAGKATCLAGVGNGGGGGGGGGDDDDDDDDDAVKVLPRVVAPTK